MTVICTSLKTPNCLLLILRISMILNTSTTLILNFKTCLKKLLELFFWKREQSSVVSKCSILTRKKTFPDCPQGRLINRKTTKSNSSTEKYTVKRLSYFVYVYTRREDKIINFLKSDLKSLWSDHDFLCQEHERLKAEANPRFTKYESNDNFKKNPTDQMELETFKSKTTDELKRLNNIFQNFQKQVSSLSYSPNK